MQPTPVLDCPCCSLRLPCTAVAVNSHLCEEFQCFSYSCAECEVSVANIQAFRGHLFESGHFKVEAHPQHNPSLALFLDLLTQHTLCTHDGDDASELLRQLKRIGSRLGMEKVKRVLEKVAVPSCNMERNTRTRATVCPRSTEQRHSGQARMEGLAKTRSGEILQNGKVRTLKRRAAPTIDYLLLANGKRSPKRIRESLPAARLVKSEKSVNGVSIANQRKSVGATPSSSHVDAAEVKYACMICGKRGFTSVNKAKFHVLNGHKANNRRCLKWNAILEGVQFEKEGASSSCSNLSAKTSSKSPSSHKTLNNLSPDSSTTTARTSRATSRRRTAPVDYSRLASRGRLRSAEPEKPVEKTQRQCSSTSAGSSGVSDSPDNSVGVVTSSEKHALSHGSAPGRPGGIVSGADCLPRINLRRTKPIDYSKLANGDEQYLTGGENFECLICICGIDNQSRNQKNRTIISRFDSEVNVKLHILHEHDKYAKPGMILNPGIHFRSTSLGCSLSGGGQKPTATVPTTVENEIQTVPKHTSHSRVWTSAAGKAGRSASQCSSAYTRRSLDGNAVQAANVASDSGNGRRSRTLQLANSREARFRLLRNCRKQDKVAPAESQPNRTVLSGKKTSGVSRSARLPSRPKLSFSCLHCDKKTWNYSTLYTHIRTKHRLKQCKVDVDFRRLKPDSRLVPKQNSDDTSGRAKGRGVSAKEKSTGVHAPRETDPAVGRSGTSLPIGVRTIQKSKTTPELGKHTAAGNNGLKLVGDKFVRELLDEHEFANMKRIIEQTMTAQMIQ